MAAVYVTTGEHIITDRTLGAGTYSGAATWTIRWGTGTSTEVKGDVDLEAGIATGGVTATSEGETTASDVCQWVGIMTATKTFTVSEAGLFIIGTGTASDMLIRGTHTAQALTAGDKIQYTFTLEQA